MQHAHISNGGIDPMPRPMTVRLSMLPNYPPRVRMLPAELIKAISKVPNTKPTVTYMDTLGTHQLMLIYRSWKTAASSSPVCFVMIEGISKAGRHDSKINSGKELKLMTCSITCMASPICRRVIR
jgi:hypothetical protein